MLKSGLFHASYYLQAPRLLSAAGARWAITTAGPVPSVRRRTTTNYTIIAYHRVNSFSDPFSIATVSTDLFEKQMAYLASHYSVLSLDEVFSRARERALPPNAAAITFDDGYADNYYFAFPILKKYSLPACIFLITASVETGEPPWFDDVLHAFRTTERRRLELSSIQASGRWETPGEAAPLAQFVLRRLREMPEASRQEVTRELLKHLAPARRVGQHHLMLNWEQVREMQRGRISFGSHTATHPILSRCDPEKIRAELRESKATLEAKLDTRTRSFAYPSGRPIDLNEEVCNQVSQAGYDIAVTVKHGWNDGESNPLLLNRMAPIGSSISEFGVRLSFSRISSAH